MGEKKKKGARHVGRQEASSPIELRLHSDFGARLPFSLSPTFFRFDLGVC